jgi:hypothetical protein
MNIEITPKTGALHYESGTPTVIPDRPAYWVPRAVLSPGFVYWPRHVVAANAIRGPPLAA